ncbi:amidohydrolase family protein [Flagellimonas zhangzhouensis]|uniref:Amidohydrolase family protein n=1 Tax=Flagellimonas zhangzhouensis TaxID=1073328 RepID=A0A1H2RNW2_9FLAO|nr:amidohydrolase family protein [Allomuricauda zhangzhouensis]SDQ65460.1 Amidohydrolase family protein [Allomuricauda zhangzhouensis]SDW20454.1 Amidohydrolase family protein [Allomuricauda zhangzhouensis]
MNRLLFLSLFLLILSGKSEPSTTYDLAITNANIIDLENGSVAVKNIYISKGKIEAVDSNIFKADSTIDATGKYVLPGFWDNHIHLRGGDTLIPNNKNFLKLFIANGITTVRDAGGDLTKEVMDWKSQIADEKLVGPTIFTAGPKIDGPNGSWAGSLEVENEADVIKAVDSLQALKVDFVKIYDSRISPKNYIKSIEEAKKRGFTVSGHMPFTVTLDETINAGMDGIEHLYYIMKGCASNEKEVTDKMNNGEMGFWGAMPELMSGYSESTANATFTKLKEHNVFVVPTLHIGETLSYLDEMDHSTDEYLKYMGSGLIQTYQGRIRSALNSSEEARTNRKQLDAFFGELAKSLDSAGVQLLAGSDSGAFNSYTYPGISLHKELQAMVENGISPLNALRTSTVNGAKFLGQTDGYGNISKGKVSDLVILEANPLENIENTEKIFKVIKGTQVFSKKQLQELLNNAILE